jgi:hypothetical protein
VTWGGDAEVIYYRTRLAITTVAALPANAPYNFPSMFPWAQAVQGSGNVGQQGTPQVAITQPTRTLIRLRLGALAAPAVMRFVLQNTDDLDTDSTGGVIPAQASFYDHTWGTHASFGAGNLGTQFPLAVLNADNPVTRLAANNGGIALIDRDGAGLAGAFVDLVM